MLRQGGPGTPQYIKTKQNKKTQALQVNKDPIMR